MGTFSNPERSRTVHSKVLKPSLWNIGAPGGAGVFMIATNSLFGLTLDKTVGESKTNYGNNWWASLDNPGLHENSEDVWKCTSAPLLPLTVFTVGLPLEEQWREIKFETIIDFKGTQVDLLLSDGFSCEQGVNNNICCFSTTNLTESRAFTATWKFAHDQEVRAELDIRGGVLIVHLMCSLSACLITVLPGSFLFSSGRAEVPPHWRWSSSLPMF